jgi:hypothetical protein
MGSACAGFLGGICIFVEKAEIKRPEKAKKWLSKTIFSPKTARNH